MPHCAFKYARLIYCQRNIRSTNISSPSVCFRTCHRFVVVGFFCYTSTHHLFVLYSICSCKVVQFHSFSVHSITNSSVFHLYFSQFNVSLVCLLPKVPFIFLFFYFFVCFFCPPKNFPQNAPDPFGFLRHHFHTFGIFFTSGLCSQCLKQGQCNERGWISTSRFLL